mmetsp:Transcript_50430/g.117710  ORF Transcript_50430/g.117710 Transcript_50430/m.117710 type:complete len:877 (-) Transcript_50430:29-2659(-)
MLTAATSGVLPLDPADRERWPDVLRVLRIKDEAVQSLQHTLEAERRHRRELQVQAAAEKSALQQQYQQQEADLRSRLQEQEAEFGQQKESFSAKQARLTEQLQEARLQQAVLSEKHDVQAADLSSLLSKVDSDKVEISAMRSRVETLTVKLQEAQSMLLTSDNIQKSLLQELEEKDALLEARGKELREAQNSERIAREQGQARFERLTTECESLSRQLQSKERDADVLDERCKRIEQASAAKEVQFEQSLKAVHERCKNLEQQLGRAEEECHGYKPLEASMKERLRYAETQLEESKAELQKVRQELFREQSASEKKEISGQALARDKGILQEQLQSAHDEVKARQEELRAAQKNVRLLEGDLEETRGRLGMAEQKVQRLEETEKPLQDRLYKQSAEMSKIVMEVNVAKGQMQAAVEQHKSELAEKDGYREACNHYSMQLSEAHNKVADLQARHAEELAIAQARPLSEDKAVLTSPRMQPLAMRDTQHWRSEMVALHRSVASMQAVVRMAPAGGAVNQQGVGVECSADETLTRHARAGNRTAVRMYVERCVDRLYRRSLLWDVWQVWLLHMQFADLRAQLDLALSDELQASRDRRLLQDSIGQARVERISDVTMATLRELLVEFRQRTSAFLSELLPSGGSDWPTVMASALNKGRNQFGRFFHASLFLYQKLRTLVGSELRETIQDPLSQLVPLPFYVLPYKLQHALRASSAAMVRGARSSRQGKGGRPLAGDAESYFSERVGKMQENLPLSSQSQVDVPHYLADLMNLRVEVNEPPSRPGGTPRVTQEERQLSQVRCGDRLDVLAADALTVFMSAWRTNKLAARRFSSNPSPAVLQRLAPLGQQAEEEDLWNLDAQELPRSPPRSRLLQLGPRPTV